MMATDGDSRRSSVRALNVSPQTPIVHPATSPPAASMILFRHPVELLVVDGDHALEQVEGVPGVGGDLQQGARVLGEAAAAPARAGAEEVLADALVVAEAEHDVVDVGADALADRRHGVDERQLGGQEGVGGVLDRLRRRRVGDDDRRRHAEVQRRHLDRRRLVGAADDDAVGLQEVLHGRALAQELRVRHDLHVGSVEDALDDARRPHGHRRLVDDDGLVRQVRGDLPRRPLDVRQVGAAVVALRRRHAQERDVAVDDGVRRPDHEAQPPGPQTLLDEPVEPVLDDRHLTGGQPGDLVGVDICAHHLVTEVGEAGAGGQTDVPGPDDGDSRHAPKATG